MPIDYSKWDKIELSDDSDIEVHPNVDKRSFIRWKQQSIHQKREERNRDIKNLETQLKMYHQLNKRVDKLIQLLPVDQFNDLDRITKFLNSNFDKSEKCVGENVDPDIGTYNEMVEDLFDQLKHDIKKDGLDPNDSELIKKYFLKHREKIDKVTEEVLQKLTQLYKEKNEHISSEDIHIGFDSSFINKSSVEEDAKTLQNTLKNLEMNKSNKNDISNNNDTAKTNPILDNDIVKLYKQFIDYGTSEDNIGKLHPLTEEFGLKISTDECEKSESFLLKHMEILSEQQKDALMMKAFEYELSNDTKMTYQIVHQAEIMSYIIELYQLKKIPFLNVDEMEKVIKMFFGKVLLINGGGNGVDTRGKDTFLDSVKTKYNHIKERCKIIQQENADGEAGDEEANAIIQLRSLDDSTELAITLPDFGSSDPNEVRRCKAFSKIPLKMQEAIKTGNLDNVNAVFEEYSYEEGEKMLELFDEAEVVGVKALLEDEKDFEQLKQDYQSEKSDATNNEQTKETTVNTADIVD
ncbi:Hsp90 co-chaperone CDC37 PWA37_003514 [Arxiozyma heterogenica]|uniref:Hsp90 chaperone protein kinase-targeting subunit n=1 Tax=Arxiozyma heterogenica TaxID=278026 RepID=A0AAN7ZYC0_9SACH|nr:hypothetical protein RI543_001983 [Kazachstania heterogenica]